MYLFWKILQNTCIFFNIFSIFFEKYPNIGNFWKNAAKDTYFSQKSPKLLKKNYEKHNFFEKSLLN